MLKSYWNDRAAVTSKYSTLWLLPQRFTYSGGATRLIRPQR